MTLELPEDMDELVYWNARKIDDGNVKAWTYRGDCPECGKAKMGKPKNKDGKAKIRAKFYECPSCKFTIDKEEYEDTLEACIIYTCPHCKHKGDTKIPYIRKNFKGVKSLIFECESCKEKIPITKKMKKPKK